MRPEPLLADAIDLPLVAFFGIVVLLPLMLFQVAVEGGILARTWHISFRQLIRPVLLANCWSLLAGIPTKFFNGAIYEYLLPNDLAGYFARYPFAVTAGTLVFFVVSVFVEALSLSRWLKREKIAQTRARIWAGVLAANIATYAVLGPLHYFGTRPIHDVTEFRADTQWAKQPPTQIVYIDSESGHLKWIYSDGSNPRTLVSQPVKDFLVTSNLDLVLYHDQQGVRCLYHADTGQVELGDAESTKPLGTLPAFGSDGREEWGGNDSFKAWRAWAEPGLGNQIRVYQTNDRPNSLVRVVVNPGLLHISDFRFALSHPAFISEGHECLFQSRNAIYLLDIEKRRVGKIANGRNFILLTPAYAKAP